MKRVETIADALHAAIWRAINELDVRVPAPPLAIEAPRGQAPGLPLNPSILVHDADEG